MKIAEKLDTGPVCNAYKINLENNLNASDVADKLSLIAAEKILDNIDNILEDRAKFIGQDHSKATYASKIQKALHTGPVSSFSAIFMTLTPVSVSRFIIDLCMGAAPLHFGKRDA